MEKLKKSVIKRVVEWFKVMHRLKDTKDYACVMHIEWKDEKGKTNQLNFAYKDQEKAERDFFQYRLRLDKYENYVLRLQDMQLNKMAEIVK